VELSQHLSLPSELEKFRQTIELSAKTSFIIMPSDQNTSLADSKFAGLPYLPKSHRLPKDRKGQYMDLLAQVNFSQFPSEKPFPKSGILQFFISRTQELLYEKRTEQIFQQDFKVRYFPEVVSQDKLVTDFSIIKGDFITPFPIKNELHLSISKMIEPVSAMDYRFNSYINFPTSDCTITEDGRTLEEFYFEHFLGADHKLGGYPYFIYNDPRSNSNFLKRFDTLLLQVVSNDSQEIMWGDSGIIKFFINKEKLLELDFSEVYFIAEQY